MAYTYDIPGSTATTLSTLVNKIDTAGLIEGNVSTGAREYTIPGSDPAHRAIIRVTNRISGPVKAQIRHVSIKISAWTRRIDSLTSEVTWSPISATIAMDVPLDGSVEVSDLDVLVSMVYGLTYTTATSGVRDTSRLANFLLESTKL